MGYDRETWVDDDGSGTVGTVFNADRMNNIEAGVEQAMPPGSILPTAAVTIPTGWLACDGSEVSRTTYADLFAAMTVSTTGNRASGSTTITNIPSTADIEVGAAVTGTGIQANTNVASVDSGTQITLSKAATSTGTGGAFVVLPYGAAASGSNFKLPDLVGRTPVGRDPAASRISTNNRQGQSGGAESHKHAATGLTATSSTIAASTTTPSTWGGGAFTNVPQTHTHPAPTITMGGATANGNGMNPYQNVRYMVKT